MPQEEARAPLPQSELDKGRGRGPLFPSPSPSFPLSPSPLEGRGANPTRNGVLVGLPPLGAAPLGPASSSPSFIYVGRGHPKGTTVVS